MQEGSIFENFTLIVVDDQVNKLPKSHIAQQSKQKSKTYKVACKLNPRLTTDSVPQKYLDQTSLDLTERNEISFDNRIILHGGTVCQHKMTPYGSG